MWKALHRQLEAGNQVDERIDLLFHQPDVSEKKSILSDIFLARSLLITAHSDDIET